MNVGTETKLQAKVIALTSNWN